VDRILLRENTIHEITPSTLFIGAKFAVFRVTRGSVYSRSRSRKNSIRCAGGPQTGLTAFSKPRREQAPASSTADSSLSSSAARMPQLVRSSTPKLGAIQARRGRHHRSHSEEVFRACHPPVAKRAFGVQALKPIWTLCHNRSLGRSSDQGKPMQMVSLLVLALRICEVCG
jgi:hypothetical protein